MCFSPTASFTATILLTAIGIKSLTNAHKSQRLLACIPLLFAAQQLSEGILWLALLHHPEQAMTRSLPYIFLFFAMILWPIWMPGSMIPLIRGKTRKIASYALLAAGGIVSALLLITMIHYGATAQMVHNHIMYDIGLPAHLYVFVTILYLSATIVPLFLTRNRWLSALGILECISYIITYIFYMNFITSVWCFFAALLSILIMCSTWHHK